MDRWAKGSQELFYIERFQELLWWKTSIRRNYFYSLAIPMVSRLPFLDLQLVITNGVVSTSIFDKRDAFDFKIVNFPTLTGNIPIKSSYGVFICETVRYARACTYFADFKTRVLILVKKLRT